MTPEVQAVGGGSREGERSKDILEDSQIHNDMQFGFGADISGNHGARKIICLHGMV